MSITENSSLKAYNTFGIDVSAKYFVQMFSVREFKEFSSTDYFKKFPRLILGGGSNILFTKNFNGCVIKNNISGIELIADDAEYYYIKAGAGENWHGLVEHCISNGYGGIENLSLIPGNVGAAPMQNIGAYGVELKDVFHELEALDIETLEIKKFSRADCKFGYRESVFKNEARDKYVITSVTLSLNKVPKFNTSYGAIENELTQMGVKELSIKKISEAVCNIRRSKLPDPAVVGNAGSFFKNPAVPERRYEELKKMFPDIVGFKNSRTEVKLAAGWLIEQCGWKGKMEGHAGVHKDQALVLINRGNAKGSEVFDLSQKVLDSVKEKFGIELQREVNIV